ncbi:MAG: acyltransferase [Treponema sp.]|jgi:hypothetical protein|nr:acyltransferase [Treponema sp.]
MEQRKKRITGFDSLRFLMVFLVIALHSAMTYMEFGVPWWYVIDDHKSLFFTFVVVFFDSFPMSVLFFLAGYFAVPSFDKRGTALFLKDKLLRLGLPWVLGVFLVAPVLARSTMTALGFPPPDALTFITQFFFGPFYQQGPYWFLGILLFFMVLFAVISALFKNAGLGPEKQNNKPGSRPWIILTILWIVSVLTYYLSGRFVKPAVDWLNAGYILYFQPSRIAGYLLVFAAGLLGWRKRWFTGGGWSPNVFFWGTGSFVSAAFLLYIKFFIAPFRSELFGLVSESFTYNATALSMTFFLTAFFSKSRNFSYKVIKYFEADAYGIYWLHMLILMPMLYLLKPLSIPIALKWVFSLPATVLVCSLLLRCGRRVWTKSLLFFVQTLHFLPFR